MKLEQASVVDQREMQGGYRLLVLNTPGIAPDVRPGQFVHIRIPRLNEAVLRRPFSVFKTEGPLLSIIYKAVGKGTESMKSIQPGETLSLMGPLGNGFPACGSGALPVLVAGGYGMAALFLQARESKARGVAFVGGRSAQDILCVNEFEALGWPVNIATEDGSLGQKGMVTDALDGWIAGEGRGQPAEFFACGPNAMLRAVADRALKLDRRAWLSMDRYMGCGVGACLTCVQKIKTPDGGWTWERVCREGPVFEARAIVWEEEGKDAK